MLQVLRMCCYPRLVYPLQTTFPPVPSGYSNSRSRAAHVAESRRVRSCPALYDSGSCHHFIARQVLTPSEQMIGQSL